MNGGHAPVRRLLARGFYLFKPGTSEQVESVVVVPSPRWQDALGPIADPKKLAQEMVRFCPDIVDQGCGTVAALARELRKNPAHLYFWWD